MNEATTTLTRADMALFSGIEMHGFEIKSDLDSLARLDRQVEHYGRFFERLTIVTGHHWGEVSARTPPWVGVLMATQNENGEFCWLRARAGGRSPHTDPCLAAQKLPAGAVDCAPGASTSGVLEPRQAGRSPGHAVWC